MDTHRTTTVRNRNGSPQQFIVDESDKSRFPLGSIVFFHCEITSHVGIVTGHNDKNTPLITHAAYFNNIAEIREDPLKLMLGRDVLSYIVFQPKTSKWNAQTLVKIAKEFRERKTVYNIQAYNNLETRLSRLDHFGPKEIIRRQKNQSRKHFYNGSPEQSHQDAKMYRAFAKTCLIAANKDQLSTNGYHCVAFASLVLQMHDVIENKIITSKHNKKMLTASRKYGFKGKNPKAEKKIHPLNFCSWFNHQAREECDLFSFPHEGKSLDPASMMRILLDNSGGGGGWNLRYFVSYDSKENLHTYLGLDKIPTQLLPRESISLRVESVKTKTARSKKAYPFQNGNTPTLNRLTHFVIQEMVLKQILAAIPQSSSSQARMPSRSSMR